MKKVVYRSLLFWVLLTSLIGAWFVFRPGSDLAQTRDDYMGYWDYRLLFFLVFWVPVSLPVWALVTYALARVSGGKDLAD